MRISNKFDLATYALEVKQFLDRDGFTLNDSVLKLAQYKKAYKGYEAVQDFLQEQDEYGNILTRTLIRFPRLESITILQGNNWIGPKEIFNEFGTLHGQEFSNGCEYLVPVLLEAMEFSTCQLKELLFVNRSNKFRLDDHPPPLLTEMDDQLPFAGLSQLHKWSHAFQDLQTLVIHTTKSYTVPRVPAAQIQGRYTRAITKLFSGTPNLKSLTLGGSSDVNLDLGTVTAATQPLKLEYISLYGFSPENGDETVELLMELSKTIKHISFGDMVPNRLFWRRVLEQSRQRTKFEVLERFDIFKAKVEVAAFFTASLGIDDVLPVIQL